MKRMRNWYVIGAVVIAAVLIIEKDRFIGNLSASGQTDTVYQAVNSQQERLNVSEKFSRMPRLWVDSVYKNMTLEERIGQLFMIRTYSNKNEHYYKGISSQIKKYKVGGLCFFQGNPVTQAKLTNRWQKESKTPLFIAIDAEWGLSMRLDNALGFPRQMTLGAIQNDTLVYDMASLMAHQLKRIGVNMNFAPVVDINSNPKNPVINSRSFGEVRENVAQKGLMYMKGLQDNGILACAKHFPGHGDTDKDSHHTLPTINHSKQYIDSVDLYPFKELIKEGVASIMVAHLHIPAYDDRVNLASTLSKPIVNDILRDKLGFNGLIITDALEMKGISNYNKPGQVEVEALKAGNDILLLPENIHKGVETIKTAVEKGEIHEDTIKAKCKRILYKKYEVGLANWQPIETGDIYKDINNKDVEAINHKLVEASITLVKNKDSILPLKRLDTLKMATVAIGSSQLNAFQIGLDRYSAFTHFNLDKKPTKYQREKLIADLEPYNLVVVSIHNTNNLAYRNFGIEEEAFDLIHELKKEKKLIVDIFANPYSLSRIRDTGNIEALLLSYDDNELTNNISSQVIFGGVCANGKLPVTASGLFKAGQGVEISSPTRLHYTIPTAINIPTDSFYKIDELLDSCIDNRILPGCRVIAAHKGNVFFDKSYGYHTYKKTNKVDQDDIYDLASLTKIFATTPAIMSLYEENKLELDAPLSKYLPMLKGTNKEGLVIRDILTHQAKLTPWIPYYLETIKNGQLDLNVYSRKKSREYPVRVANNLYVKKSFADTIYKRILDSELRSHKKYKYSDLGFYLWVKAIERITGKTFNKYLQENLYNPMGLATMGYLPRERFSLKRIPPSERDMIWRKQDVHGDVNDQGAALLGGICGHAGLFSNAYNAAALGQMFLNYGEYGGKRYFKKSTIKEFTKYQFPGNGNRRGLGFDKPIAKVEERNGQTPPSASTKSFGHSGFTGTLVWADPEHELLYVFLSNRTYPKTKPNLLSKLDIRCRIHQVFYEAVEKAE